MGTPLHCRVVKEQSICTHISLLATVPKNLTRGLHRLVKLLRQSFGHYGFEINRKPKKTEFSVLIWRGLTAKRERHLDPLRFGEPLTMAPPLTMAQKRSKVGQIFRLPYSGFAAQFRGSDAPKVMPFSHPDLGTALTETCNGLPKIGPFSEASCWCPGTPKMGPTNRESAPSFSFLVPCTETGP